VFGAVTCANVISGPKNKKNKHKKGTNLIPFPLTLFLSLRGEEIKLIGHKLILLKFPSPFEKRVRVKYFFHHAAALEVSAMDGFLNIEVASKGKGIPTISLT